MAGKAQHKYQIRQNPDNTFSILAKNQEGEEFWFGSYSLKQAAVRWGDSHKIPTRFPQVVERSVDSDPYGLMNQSTSVSAQKDSDPIDRSILSLLKQVDIQPSDAEAVASFLGVGIDQLVSIVDPTTGEIVYQMPKVS